MDSTLLKPDEIQVEFELRKIPSNDPQGLEKLQELLDAEIRGTQTKPMKMTSKASKRPDLEIESCRSKLEGLREHILNLEQVLPADLARKLLEIQSRLLHVKGRLELAMTSVTYEAQARKSLKSCNELISSIDKYISLNEPLNSSIVSAKHVEIDTELVIPPTSQVLTELIKVAPPCPTDDNVEPIASSSQNHVTSKQQPIIQSIPRTIIDNTTNTVDTGALVLTLVAHVRQLSEQIGTLAAQQQELQTRFESKMPKMLQSMSGPSISNPKMSRPVTTTAYANPPEFQNPNTHSYAGNQGKSSMGSYTTDKPRSLARSGISFDGSPGGLPADLFILQVETLANSMNISSQSLLNELSFVLKGTALHWYWNYRRHNPNLSWNQLRVTFLEKFEDRRTDIEIRQEIESRRQSPKESFLQFYQHVWGLTLQCHTPYPEDRLIEVLMRNMNPQLQYHLTDRYFLNVNDLIKSCAAWENTWSRLKMNSHYTSFSRPAINEMNNFDQNCDFRYTNESQSECPGLAALKHPSEKPPKSPVTPQYQVLSRPFKSVDREPICFNCCDIGNTFRECSLPQGFFCYRCGYRNTTSSQCPRCSGNISRGQWRSGNPAPQTASTPSQNLTPPLSTHPTPQPRQPQTRTELSPPRQNQTFG